jgi:hypothetical protein
MTVQFDVCSVIVFRRHVYICYIYIKVNQICHLSKNTYVKCAYCIMILSVSSAVWSFFICLINQIPANTEPKISWPRKCLVWPRYNLLSHIFTYPSIVCNDILTWASKYFLDIRTCFDLQICPHSVAFRHGGSFTCHLWYSWGVWITFTFYWTPATNTSLR